MRHLGVDIFRDPIILHLFIFCISSGSLELVDYRVAYFTVHAHSYTSLYTFFHNFFSNVPINEIRHLGVDTFGDPIILHLYMYFVYVRILENGQTTEWLNLFVHAHSYTFACMYIMWFCLSAHVSYKRFKI